MKTNENIALYVLRLAGTLFLIAAILSLVMAFTPAKAAAMMPATSRRVTVRRRT